MHVKLKMCRLLIILQEFDDSGRDDDGNVADEAAASSGQGTNGSSRNKHRKEIIKKVGIFRVLLLFVWRYCCHDFSF